MESIGWLIIGILIGSFLDQTTSLILVFLKFVIENDQMPNVLGGFYPQDLLQTCFYRLGESIRNFINNNNHRRS